MNKEETVINYYILCNGLKNVIRTGWKVWKVKRDRIESVADHIYGTQMIAIAMDSQYKYDIDLSKVLFMLAVHELEEIKMGDLIFSQISDSDRLKEGYKAVNIVLKDLLKKDTIESLINEFNERKTKEAIFAYHCDKLEWDLQSKLYDEEKCVDMNDQLDNPVYFNSEVQRVMKEGNTSFSSMCMEFDRSKFSDDDNFTKVMEYAKKNKFNHKNN